jgi:hypothetical protein
VAASAMFDPHPNLSDSINGEIIQSEIEGGVYVQNLSDDRPLEVQTQHRSYFLLRRGAGDTVIWGHPIYCPEPVQVAISGSNWGGSMLKVGFIGRGMHLEFRHPDYAQPIVTSRIEDMRELTGSDGPPSSKETAAASGSSPRR